MSRQGNCARLTCGGAGGILCALAPAELIPASETRDWQGRRFPCWRNPLTTRRRKTAMHMSLPHILVIAVGLAADAFAVSVAEGMALHKVTADHTLRLSLHFGAYQAIMPVIGWLAGSSLRAFIGTWDHWVAFALLTLLGAKMIADSAMGVETGQRREPSRGIRLVALSIATSIDALAVGVSLAMLRVQIWLPAALTGVVTGALSAVGVQMGDRIGTKLGRAAELAGGALLCLIGFKVLLAHLKPGAPASL